MAFLFGTIVGVVLTILFTAFLAALHRRQERREAEQAEEGPPRLVVNAPLTEEQLDNLRGQQGSRSVLGVVLHALEIRGYLYHASQRGHIAFLEDDEGDVELDFHFDSDEEHSSVLH